MELDKNHLIDEAIRIGDELVKQAIHDKNGCFWKTADGRSFKAGNSLDSSLRIVESLYNGVSGIATFLMELHIATGDQKYLDVATDAGKWLFTYCKTNPASSYSFHTGRLGTLYFLFQLGMFLGDENWKREAIQLAKAEIKDLNIKGVKSGDLLNGLPGYVLGLLHIHALTNEDDFLKKINELVGLILDGVIIDKTGVCWDRSFNQIRPLCGFSHGAAGVGFLFLELGHYLSNEAFYFMAEQAFAYENRFFDEKENNWPDFRKDLYEQKHLDLGCEKFRNGEADFFTSHSYMGAWCHGAPGIGLSRLRAYQLLGKETYGKDLSSAIDYVLSNSSSGQSGSFTLCHGYLGNMALVLESIKLFDDPKDLVARCYEAIEKALHQYAKYGHYLSGLANLPSDPSLFLGDAGIGYFILQLITKDSKSGSLLFPILGERLSSPLDQAYRWLNITKVELMDHVARLFFSKTLEGSVGPIAWSTSEISLQDTIINTLSSLVADSSNQSEQFPLEMHKIQLMQSVNGFREFICQRMSKIDYEGDRRISWETLKIGLSPVVLILPNESLIDSSNEDQVFTLLIADHLQCHEFSIAYFQFLVFKLFEEPKTVKEIVQLVANYVEKKGDTALSLELEQLVKDQTRAALQSGILLPVRYLKNFK